MSKLEMLKQLEHLVAFQTDCLSKGDWETFDNTQNLILKIERELLASFEKVE